MDAISIRYHCEFEVFHAYEESRDLVQDVDCFASGPLFGLGIACCGSAGWHSMLSFMADGILL